MDDSFNNLKGWSNYRLLNTNTSNTQFHQMIEDELLRRENELNERLKKIESTIIELKKPHWNTVPTFWFVVFGSVVAVLSLIVSVLSSPQAQKFFYLDRISQKISFVFQFLNL